mgnify:CR=1 FL=1
MVASGVTSSAFPFSSYRRGQREAIEAARDAFAAGKRFVVIEAPTGSGKSAIGVTLAREANSAFVLTAQKILQDQYVTDFPDLALMKGRSNYDCLVRPTHAAAAPCIAGKRFPECDACPYFTAKGEAIAANVATMNYAYFLAELNYSGGFGHRDLLVLDEAHNIEGALMGFVQVTVSEVALTRAGISTRIPYASEDYEYLDFVEELLPVVRAKAQSLEDELKSGKTRSGDIELSQLRNKQWLDNLSGRLRLLLDSVDDDLAEWTVERTSGSAGQTLTFKPVLVNRFSEPLLFAHADRVLMLSATILDAETFLASLDIDPGEAQVITVESDFPAQSRPIYVKPTAKLTRQHLDRELPRLAREVSRILDEHPYEKGIVHAHSYRIAGFLATALREEHGTRIITHGSAGERDAALTSHLTSSAPTVLLTPSMTEGIDLSGDLSRFQVIVKIPYPFLGDPQVRRRTELDGDWYQWRTCLTVVQAYGRSIRSRDDHAVTYLLDADFPAFLRRQSKRLPAWFREALIPQQ